MMFIEVTSKVDLVALVDTLLQGAGGLPVVMNAQGAWGVMWGPSYPVLTIELKCCRYFYPNGEALPSEDFRCPHGEWLVKYHA